MGSHAEEEHSAAHTKGECFAQIGKLANICLLGIFKTVLLPDLPHK